MSEKLVPNEILAFLQYQLDVMDEVSIAQICKTNFTEEEIRAAKSLLYSSLNIADKMPSRRRDDKGERSLQDIIKVLKETDPDDVPTFVVKNLRKLPPVTFDHVDVTRLLRDITSLRSSLADLELKFEASQNTVAELRTEVVALSNSKPVCMSPETANVNTRRGARCAADSFESANSSAADIAAQPALLAEPVPPPAPHPVVTPVSRSTPRGYATAAASNSPTKQQRINTERGPDKNHRAPLHSAEPQAPRRGQVDEEGFTKVERKKKFSPRRNYCGTAPTGPNPLLRAAAPSTLLYVSRLYFTTQATDLVEYMKMKSNYILRVVKLHSRNKMSFNSFVVRVPNSQLALFMKEDFWPNGVVFRRFRGRLVDTPPLPQVSCTKPVPS